MATDEARWSRGRAAYASQLEVSEDEVFAHLTELVGERMATEAINAAGDAWQDDVLSLRDRSLIVVTALAAQGSVDERLRVHARWAAAHGVAPDQLEALTSLLAVYVGFPKASVAAEIIRDATRPDGPHP
jgi:4-carboxymuconolactone decarboxylase